MKTIAHCWHCNHVVMLVLNGWVCPQCYQNGTNDGPAATAKEGALKNQPYIGKKQ